MKRCIICNYRARTNERLMQHQTQGGFWQYKCREEHQAKCDAKATRRLRAMHARAQGPAQTLS